MTSKPTVSYGGPSVETKVLSLSRGDGKGIFGRLTHWRCQDVHAVTPGTCDCYCARAEILQM